LLFLLLLLLAAGLLIIIIQVLPAQDDPLLQCTSKVTPVTKWLPSGKKVWLLQLCKMGMLTCPVLCAKVSSFFVATNTKRHQC
jgi:hypothetical protein